MCNGVENVEISKFDNKCLELSFIIYFIEFSVKNNLDWYSLIVMLRTFETIDISGYISVFFLIYVKFGTIGIISKR